MTAIATSIEESSVADARLVRQIVQPGLLGLMDGSVSTLAPLFATANLNGSPRAAFFVGVAAAVGAGVSMGFAEALASSFGGDEHHASDEWRQRVRRSNLP